MGDGPYGVRHRDPDGNEVDLVPGEALGTGDDTADWSAVFSAMASYHVATPEQQARVASAVAEVAAYAGFPLLIDLRPGVVILDSGKDQWEPTTHGLDLDFIELAARLQSEARALGASADPGLARFVQLFIDAADVASVRSFWLGALGYVEDPRPEVTDIIDPRRCNPVLVFQELDRSETERRRQRNRIRLVLTLPADVATGRMASIGTLGGRIVDDSAGRWLAADPEGNELLVVAGD